MGKISSINGYDLYDAESRSIANEAKEAIDALDTATSSDVGKALSPKTVANGKVIEWEYKAIPDCSGSGISETMRTTLYNFINAIAENVGYSSTNGQALLTDFNSAWGESSSGGSDTPITPTKTLQSITAAYSGGTVVEGTSVNSLTGITVTAHYSDSTTETITGYTRSGTISVGNNTVTLTYSGKTTTITVVGTAQQTEPDEPTVTRELQSISATYSGGSVEEGTLATALTGITVTGTYNVSPLTETITGWSISGTVAEGTNTFTISYGGKTCTISVTGTAIEPEGWTGAFELVTPTTGENEIGFNQYYKMITSSGYIDYSTTSYEGYAVSNPVLIESSSTYALKADYKLSSGQPHYLIAYFSDVMSVGANAGKLIQINDAWIDPPFETALTIPTGAKYMMVSAGNVQNCFDRLDVRVIKG